MLQRVGSDNMAALVICNCGEGAFDLDSICALYCIDLSTVSQHILCGIILTLLAERHQLNVSRSYSIGSDLRVRVPPAAEYEYEYENAVNWEISHCRCPISRFARARFEGGFSR